MLFTLEALQAEQGDALILHCGDPKSPRLFVVDGGPATVYKRSLKPRLQALWKKFKGKNGKLAIEMVMLSHIDDDHIHGLLDWMDELVEADQNGQDLPYGIQTMWYNSFDEVLGNGAEELRSRVASVASASLGAPAGAQTPMEPHSAAVIASVAQGRKLRDAAVTLGFSLNGGFRGLVAAKDKGSTVIDLGGGLKFTVLSPGMEQLSKLQDEWEKDVRKHPPAETAAFVDRSVYNLSSIAVLAEFQGKSILLTGDARGDHVLAGLERAGRLKSGGAIHVDILKLPHHGSQRNVAPAFFERIAADHYVISANGLYDNPDVDTLKMIAAARGASKYAIHLTNHDMKNKDGVDIGAQIRKFLDGSKAPGRKVEYRDPKALSVKVDLLDAVKD